MLERIFLPEGVGRRFAVPALFIMMVTWGCASMSAAPDRKKWTCDPGADAAVARQDWHRGLLEHQKFLEKEPGHCLALYHLGYIHGKLGDRLAEAAHYEQAVECGYKEDERLFFNLGMAYGEMSRAGKALASFEKAVALNPQNAENHFGLGLTAQTFGLTERARKALSEAIRIDPLHWEARIILTRIYLDQGQLEAAGIQLEALSKGKPNDSEVDELLEIYNDRRISIYDH